MLKRFLLLIHIVSIMFLFAACFDSSDIDKKALVSLVLMDRQDEAFVFYVEVPNLAVGQGQGSGGGEQEQYSITSGRGASYVDARRDLDVKMDKPVFLGTVGALVMTDKLIDFGIEEYLLRLQNLLSYRKTLNIVTTTERPEDIMSVRPENNISVGYSIEDTINELEDSGTIVAYSTSDILEFLYARYCYVLPNMDLRDGRLAYTGYTIIHNNQYYGFIPAEEAKGILFLLGDHAKVRYVVPFDDYTATVEVELKSRKVEPTYADQHVGFRIDFSFGAVVIYLSNNVKFDSASQTQVKETLQQMIMEDVTNAIQQSKTTKCDYLGFKEHFRIHYPNDVKQMDWLPAYLDSSMNVSVSASFNTSILMDFEAQGQAVGE